MNRNWQRGVVCSAMVFSMIAVPGQGPQVRRVMHEKLVHAQQILEALVTSEWDGLARHASELEALTNDPRWTVLKYPEYATHSEAFVRAIRDLRAAAERRDLEKAPEAYNALTLQCVECHRYLARARIAR